MTVLLSNAGFHRACAFVEDHGRPLDAALLRYELGEGPAEAVLTALAAYQNPDGGFGHGLEPDMATPASSAIGASVGLRFLRRIEAGGGHPMVRAALDWLEASFDCDAGVWPIITAAVDEGPHAPWWAWSRDLAESWNGFRFNPSAELLACLYAWRADAPPALVEAAEARMRRTLADTEVIEGAYDLKCAVRLAETESAPADLRQRLTDLVARSALASDPADPHAAVLELAPAPASLLAAPLADRIEAALDALVAAQQPDGGWPVFWDWSFVDAAAWTKARHDWRGWITRDAIEALRAWGRVEGS
ncbi:MAG TPA: hypothetical protein VHZ26_17955 [Caulobacteraceae bacterium]|jgi:hypothetical protein|nr:hypothetical protein [Caulobacteraceae bacterium]